MPTNMALPVYQEVSGGKHKCGHFNHASLEADRRLERYRCKISSRRKLSHCVPPSTRPKRTSARTKRRGTAPHMQGPHSRDGCTTRSGFALSKLERRRALRAQPEQLGGLHRPTSVSIRKVPKTLFRHMTRIPPRYSAYRGHTTLDVHLDRFAGVGLRIPIRR
jgi:hypothetical protein